VFELPNDIEKAGFSKVNKAVLMSDKLEALGWQAKTNIEEGIAKTISILKEEK
jgi:nucleoside-diphosphate-sugar epimerase